MRALGLVLLVLTLSRPQVALATLATDTEGIDIALVLDTSSSMTARDFGGQSRMDGAKAAMRDAAIQAQQAGVKVALTLSDAFCVARFRDEFTELVRNHVDILFANESEILSLYQVTDFDEAARLVTEAKAAAAA